MRHVIKLSLAMAFFIIAANVVAADGDNTNIGEDQLSQMDRELQGCCYAEGNDDPRTKPIKPANPSDGSDGSTVIKK